MLPSLLVPMLCHMYIFRRGKLRGSAKQFTYVCVRRVITLIKVHLPDVDELISSFIAARSNN